MLRVHGLKAELMCYTGDDLVDIAPMGMAGLAIAVADAHPVVREAAHWITPSAGGAGAVREVCELLLTAHGHSYDELVAWASG